MPLGHGPRAGHEDVHRHVALAPRLPRLDRVELHLARGVRAGDRPQCRRHLRHLVGRQCVVHEAVHGVPHQPPPGPQDVEGHADGDQRVQRHPAGHGDEADAHDHADRGPHVGEQVLAVRDEGRGPVPATGAQDEPADDAVDDGRDDGDGQADAEILQRPRVHQSLDGRHDDQRRRDEDHQALGAGREVLDLAVAEVMRVVRGTRGDRERHQGEHGRHQVDHGLQRVRQQADGPGEQVGGRLQRDGRDRGADRQPGPAEEARRRRVRSPRPACHRVAPDASLDLP